MDWKLELLPIPVTDVDRAKAFYVEQAGFIADHDHVVSDEIRFVQLTPPGSACSIALGHGVSDAEPGSARAQLVVTDIEAAHAELVERGVDVGPVTHFEAGGPVEGRGEPLNSFVFFTDPDGNHWAVQEKPATT